MATIKGRDLKDSWSGFIMEGSEPAFYALYTHYYHYLNLLGVRRGFSDDKIKDSISDVFFYLWENRAKLGHISSHHNYIITAFLRKLYRKHAIVMEEMPEPEALPEALNVPSVEALFIKQDLDENVSELIKEKLDQLGDKQRHLVYQKFYLGLSYQEIADQNNVSINTVYNTIYKAAAKLKSLLTKEQEAFLSLAISFASLGILFFFQM